MQNLRQRCKVIFSILGSYAVLVGIVTFPLFIHEEALQTIMFGTWAASAADDQEMVLRGVDAMRVINKSMRAINLALGWVNPLSFTAYQHYATSADYYAAAAEAKAMHKKPNIMDGRPIFRFVRIERKQYDGEAWIAGDGKVFVRLNYEPKIGERLEIHGTAELVDGRLLFRNARTQRLDEVTP